MAVWNPFAPQETHSIGAVRTHKLTTILTWLLSAAVSLHYTLDGPQHGFKTVWDQNYAHPSAFTMNHIVAEAYWALLFLLQLGFILHLFSRTPETVYAAANVGRHFVVNNILHTAFVALFVRSHFHWAELVLLLNLANLSGLYFGHDTYSRFIHVPVASGPLAWTFVAVLWNGALMLPHPAHAVPRILGNVFIWAILTYGTFFVIVFDDSTMSFALCVLSAAIGVAQFQSKIIALQWIFAFVVAGLLFVMTVVNGCPFLRGREQAVEDVERAPLLSSD